MNFIACDGVWQSAGQTPVCVGTLTTVQLDGSLEGSAAEKADKKRLLHEALQEFARSVRLFPERFIESSQVVEPRIQTHEIYHLKRTHRVIETELCAHVDVIGCAETFL